MTICDYCERAVHGERCRNCGAPAPAPLREPPILLGAGLSVIWYDPGKPAPVDPAAWVEVETERLSMRIFDHSYEPRKRRA